MDDGFMWRIIFDCIKGAIREERREEQYVCQK
jgi:hypothetical protein